MTPTATSAALFLDAHKDDIVRRFVHAIQRQDLPPEGTHRSLLIDHLPQFLDELSAELVQRSVVRDTQDAFDTSATARLHGDQRWKLGYDLEALIREYGVLRHCILTAVRDAGEDLSVDEFDVLAKCLNVGVAEAAAAYVRHRDEQVQRERENLAFLAEAGQALSASLDYRTTLSQLTRLIVPRLADACVIHVEAREGSDAVPLAHVEPAKEQALRELVQNYPSSEPCGYVAGRVEQSQLVARVDDQVLQACAKSPGQLALLRTLNFCSWMVVPLKVQNTIFGAIVLSYGESNRRYCTSDLTLVEELARRAAVAIENARLYAASQVERARVEDATRAKDEFVAMISHELRTPLNAVLGWTRMLRTGVLTESKRAHALEVIERNTISQNQLIDDLLDISRIITGNMRIDLAETDVGHVVELVVESMRPGAETKQVALQVELERPLPAIRADADRVRQIVSNLVANALKFTPKGGSVRVSLRHRDSVLELGVEDTGIGISRDFLPHVFEQFRQSQAGTTRAQGGLGIGLAIVKHLVELHGGDIVATSRGAGRGATFVVRLPTEQRSAPAQVRGRGTGEAAQPAPGEGLQNLRVLVVDDEPDTRELLGTVLEACGIVVSTARNVAEALVQIEREELDVIVSDIGMPGADGYSLIRSVRGMASAKKRDLPALALTAYARLEDRERAYAAGFTAYATKPIEPASLIAFVAELSRKSPRLESEASGS